MQIALIDFPPFFQLFHTDDDTLPEEQFKQRIYDKLSVKFGTERLLGIGIKKPEDLKIITLSIEV